MKSAFEHPVTADFLRVAGAGSGLISISSNNEPRGVPGFAAEIFHNQKRVGRRYFYVPDVPPASCTYLLPIRRKTCSESQIEELAEYLRSLSRACAEVIVVDGSPDHVFAAHQDKWGAVCRHLPVNRAYGYLNDKANGVLTGVHAATEENLVLGDDDVRYRPDQLLEICERLKKFDVVRPQNFLAPLPWWARMEGARMLINRALLAAGDYPGTCAFRRSAMQATGEYDGDVLFDNEEMIRHFARAGLKIDYAVDFFIRKIAPTRRKWLEQRTRQAYEDFQLRAKTVFFAGLFPAAIAATIFFGWWGVVDWLSFVGLGSIALACKGRRRGIARRFFPVSIPLFAPLWIFERAVSTYVAFAWYVLRGGYPFGDRLLSRGVGRDWFDGARVGPRS